MSTRESFIILAAGKPYQGEKPILLNKVNGRSLFDWQISNAASTQIHPQVVVGYGQKDFYNLSDKATFHTNSNWEKSSSAYSLFCADLSAQEITVSYADILYRTSVLQQIKSSTADITIIYDSFWSKRYSGRTQEDLAACEKVVVTGEGVVLCSGKNIETDWASGEFIGLVNFKGEAVTHLQELQKQDDKILETLTLPDLIEWLRLKGHSIFGYDVQGDWAELNQPQDIAHFILGTKAETLARLSNMVKNSIVQEQVSFTVEDWQLNRINIINEINVKFLNDMVVVRSSARSEDAFTHSNAGAYTSLLNVDASINPEVELAIEKVISSYIDCQPEDQVLVQPMVKDVRLSGVAFTQTLEYSAPFYVINYDESDDTESITSGTSEKHRSLYLRKDADISILKNKYLIPLVIAIKEVEQILNYDALDIEFAMDSKGRVYLLQARPITVNRSKKFRDKSRMCDRDSIISKESMEKFTSPFTSN